METLVNEVLTEIQPDLVNRKIQWIRPPLPSARGDVNLLRQIWVNLINNAVKYSRPRNPAMIEIGCETSATELVYFVKDNGVGFDMEYADKLFGVFNRLHPERDFEGTGVGLANVRRMVQRHGGRTWADAKLDQGATFYFSLPR